MAEFSEAPTVFGNMQYFLNRDMGMALPFEIGPYHGQGEIIDASPPPSEDTVSVDNEDGLFLEDLEVMLDNNMQNSVSHALSSQGTNPDFCDYPNINVQAPGFLGEEVQETGNSMPIPLKVKEKSLLALLSTVEVSFPQRRSKY